MSGVSYAGPTNSTLFTNCCQLAILDNQQKCPGCKQDVHPFYEGMSDDERERAAGGYYNHNTSTARHAQARRRRSA